MDCPHCGKEIPEDLLKKDHAARAGRAKSEAKSAAARANGAKGGRPRKEKKDESV